MGAEGLDPSPWSNGAGDVYAAHEHGYDKILVVAAGSIRFGLPRSAGGDAAAVDLSVGDRLELPAGTRHDAVVGPSGVVCLEAHLPAGHLGPMPRRRPAGHW
jgi:uncharacterized protein YjlB